MSSKRHIIVPKTWFLLAVKASDEEKQQKCIASVFILPCDKEEERMRSPIYQVVEVY